MHNIDTLRQKASDLVKEAFREKLEEATQNRLSVFESRDEHITEEEEDRDEDKSDDDDDDKSDDDDDKSDNDDDDTLEEALKVGALPTSERGKGTRMKAEQITVKDMRELTRLAKTGKYDYFTVEKKNGDVEEYMVENGKLVLM